MDAGEMALMIPIIAVSIPVVAIWSSHLQKMAQIKSERGTNLAPDARAELDRLREEVAALRETTTRFDMSFDAALTHLEDRMDKAATVGNSVPPVSVARPPVTPTADNSQETIYAGQGR